MEVWQHKIPPEITNKFCFYNYNNAGVILDGVFKEEFEEILDAMSKFEITTDDILAAGGNESAMPKKFSDILRPKGWKESKISADLIVHISRKIGKNAYDDYTAQINNYIDGHNIDYFKGRVALDFEWNSKDQTFDRDLFAFRTYYECNIISVAVIVTRSAELNKVFDAIDRKATSEREKIKKKYGASTTWIGKLLYRLESRRHGGCPVLAAAILPKCVVDFDC